MADEYTKEEMEDAGLSEEETAAVNDKEEGSPDEEKPNETGETPPADSAKEDAKPDATGDAEEGKPEDKSAEVKEKTEETEDSGAADKIAADAAAKEDTPKGDDGADSTEQGEETVRPPLASVAPSLPAEESPETKEKMAAIAEQFENGDIDMNTMLSQRDAVQRVAMNEAFKRNQWYSEVDVFLGTKGNEIIRDNAALFAQFDETIKHIARTSDSEMTGPQILAKARAELEKGALALIGGALAPDPNKNKDEDPAPKGDGSPVIKRPDLQNLGDFPAAKAPETGENKFSHMDGLEGLALEAAIDRMSEEEKEAYRLTD